LESSDIDGGSSVAVLTYLRRILESLDHPDMINLILHYLLALPDIVPSASTNSRDSVSAARKRKSMDLASLMASQQSEITATPLLFNLVDLILACLRSQSHQTIDVTLQLVSAILKRHHRYAVITLLHTERVRSEYARRTVGAHQQELEFLMMLAGVIGGQDDFNHVYEDVLRDTTVRLEGHPCSLKLVAPRVSINNHKLPAIPDSLPGAPQDVPSHTLRPDDPVLNIILDRLETFFLNPVATNLSLTEAIFDLAVCGFMNIEGWFLRNPRVYTYHEDDEITNTTSTDPSTVPPTPDSPAYAEFQKIESIKQCRRSPQWTPSTLPRLLSTVQTLVDEVAAYRETIPRFDDLLQQRREAFQTADAEPAPPPPPPRNNQLSTPGSATPARNSDDLRSGSPAPRPSGLEGFAQRILGELGTPSRSASPRGRKERERERSTGGGGGGGGDVRTPAPAVPPKEFPLGLETPSRPGMGPTNRSYSPAGTPFHDGRPDAVNSQLKAFQAVDQSILARRVGLPAVESRKEMVEPIPLRFDKPDDAGSGEGTAATSPVIGQDDDDDDDDKTPLSTPDEEKTASVSHVLTNVILLQNFLFELASLVQVRAGLFDEVRFA
jgi:hypothetical protein